ncbi:3-deoxy-8-phosphooctulonate synthase [Chitinophagales bacterium]|nr:3-deoxy-8-phosphooctulonate synthase [Chitinophagales bacterium]
MLNWDELLAASHEAGFFLIAGPCAVENREIVMGTGDHLRTLCERLRIPLIFKSSYRKANRTRLDSFSGIGDEKALRILKEAGESLELPIITDIHEVSEISAVSEVADVLQIPAFLCRQTALLLAAGESGKIVNIKKGQFLSAEMMGHAAEKVASTGNKKIMLTERGNSFGYGNLVVDFRNIPLLNDTGYPSVMDCTHSVQQPNSSKGVTGGTPQFVETMAKCGLVAGARGLFIETHPDPSKALSDGANMLPLAEMESLLLRLKAIAGALRN